MLQNFLFRCNNWGLYVKQCGSSKVRSIYFSSFSLALIFSAISLENVTGSQISIHSLYTIYKQSCFMYFFWCIAGTVRSCIGASNHVSCRVGAIWVVISPGCLFAFIIRTVVLNEWRMPKILDGFNLDTALVDRWRRIACYQRNMYIQCFLVS